VDAHFPYNPSPFGDKTTVEISSERVPLRVKIYAGAVDERSVSAFIVSHSVTLVTEDGISYQKGEISVYTKLST